MPCTWVPAFAGTTWATSFATSGNKTNGPDRHCDPGRVLFADEEKQNQLAGVD
jgi:hypothetical protein